MCSDVSNAHSFACLCDSTLYLLLTSHPFPIPDPPFFIMSSSHLSTSPSHSLHFSPCESKTPAKRWTDERFSPFPLPSQSQDWRDTESRENETATRIPTSLALFVLRGGYQTTKGNPPALYAPRRASTRGPVHRVRQSGILPELPSVCLAAGDWSKDGLALGIPFAAGWLCCLVVCGRDAKADCYIP